ncbi:MAG: creatininase family protein, partial [Actinocatenispora sp.]
AGADCARPLVLAPTIPVGASDHHLPFGGTLSLSPETLQAVLLDLARSVAAGGGRRLVIVNGHGGNRGVCHAAAAAASTRHGLAVGYLDYWTLLDASGDPRVPGHAGEFETSMVLAVRPELVRSRTPRDEPRWVPVVRNVDIYSGAVWRDIEGYTDDPARADAGQGDAWLETCVATLSDRLIDLAVTL